MSKFKPADDVVVLWDGVEHRGEVEKVEHGGWLRCRIALDPINHYASAPPPPALDPQPIVLVRDTEVRHAHES